MVHQNSPFLKMTIIFLAILGCSFAYKGTNISDLSEERINIVVNCFDAISKMQLYFSSKPKLVALAEKIKTQIQEIQKKEIQLNGFENKLREIMPFPTSKTASSITQLVMYNCGGKGTLTKIRDVAEVVEGLAYNVKVKKQLKSVTFVGFEGQKSKPDMGEKIKYRINKFLDKGPLGKELEPIKSNLSAGKAINVPRNLVLLNHRCFTSTENDHFDVKLIK